MPKRLVGGTKNSYNISRNYTTVFQLVNVSTDKSDSSDSDYYYVTPGNLAKKDNSYFEPCSKEYKLAIEDYKETIIKSIGNLSLNEKKVRESWDSIYHLKYNNSFNFYEKTNQVFVNKNSKKKLQNYRK